MLAGPAHIHSGECMPLKYQLTAEEYAQFDEAKQGLYALQDDVYICQIDGLPQ